MRSSIISGGSSSSASTWRAAPWLRPTTPDE